MPLTRGLLNGGAGIVHVIDTDQVRLNATAELKAICGKKPSGGKTKMGARRSRWRYVNSRVDCDKCLEKLLKAWR